MITSKIIDDAASVNLLQQQAFKNSLQANIIFEVKSGKIILVNRAAGKLLGYSQKELLTINRSAIFDVNESSFIKMLRKMKADGQSVARVTAIKKNGKKIPCEMTAARFTGEHGFEKSIVTIADRSKTIQQQKEVDAKSEKTVKNNIIAAKTRQKEIDARKQKMVADDIAIAKSKQKKIDTISEKLVADNIIIAKHKQEGIDLKKEKIVADNILIALEESEKNILDHSVWLKSIGEVSYDVMWDWNIRTGKIYVGESVKEVFGYRLTNNTVNFKNVIACLIPEEKDRVEKKLLKMLASASKSWKDSFMLKRQDGSTVATTSRANIVRNKDGKVTHLVGAIQDVNEIRELEQNLSAQRILQWGYGEKFREVAKISFDVIWDWNIATGEVFRGEGFGKLIGVSKEVFNDDSSDWHKHIHPDDKEGVEKEIREVIQSSALNSEFAFRFLRADGTIVYVLNRSIIIRNANGKARRMIGVLHDLTLQKELEEKLEKEITARETMISEHKKNFELLFNSVTDVSFDHDFVTDKLLISDAYTKQFGYQITNDMTPAKDWLSHIYPEDKEALFQEYKRAIESQDTEWTYNYRFLKADNSVVNVTTIAIILRDVTGKAYRMFGSLHDISKEQMLEEKVVQEIKLKEKQIADAVEDAKEAERVEIGKELHDNINQLLGASKLYIDMAKKGGKDSKTYLSQSSKYTLEAIEEIRKLTKGLTADTIENLGLCESIENIAEQTMEVNPVIIICSLKSFNENSVHDKFKVNLYRIVQEQLNNILKHAKASEVTIGLLQNNKNLLLTISDNGVGFDTNQKRKGIGIANIENRAKTYNGNAVFVSQPGKGCILEVKFPVPLPK